MIEGRFVSICRRYRLHFKVDPLKARKREGLAQTREGERIILLRLRADKTHRPAHHGIAHRSVKLRCRTTAQIGEDAGDQVFQRAMAAKHRRSCKRAIGKIGFERLNQAALVLSRQVVLDRSRARPGLGFRAAGAL